MIPRTPLRDSVYGEILRRLHRGDLPPASRVRDAELAGQLGVSRTPVREALLRMAREGVLQADAGKGFRVPPLATTEIKETGAILAELESLALSLIPDPEPALLDRLAGLARQLEQTRGDAARCIELDEEWHRAMLEQCPNDRLLRLITTLRQVPHRYLHAYMREAGRLSLSTLYHGKILEALRQGDRAEAVRQLRQRWRRGVEELVAWIDRSGR
jgi:DNA-binding GntR family transcriptional regulator